MRWWCWYANGEAANHRWFQLGWKRDNKSSHVTWRVLINCFLLFSRPRGETLEQQQQLPCDITSKRFNFESTGSEKLRSEQLKSRWMSMQNLHLQHKRWELLMNTVFSSLLNIWAFGFSSVKVKRKPIRIHSFENEWMKLIWFGNMLEDILFELFHFEENLSSKREKENFDKEYFYLIVVIQLWNAEVFLPLPDFFPSDFLRFCNGICF